MNDRLFAIFLVVAGIGLFAIYLILHKPTSKEQQAHSERKADVGWKGLIAPLLFLAGIATLISPLIGLKNAILLCGFGSSAIVSMYLSARRRRKTNAEADH